MGEFAIGPSVVAGSRIRACSGGGRYVGDVVLSRQRLRLRAALAARPCAHSLNRYDRAKASARVTRGANGRGLAGIRWGDLPCLVGSSAATAELNSPPYPALGQRSVRLRRDYVASWCEACSKRRTRPN